MLVTNCKHCAARFRVTPEQLNARQGQVRCGECGGVFNGFEALERFPGDDTGARLLAARGAPRTPEVGGVEATKAIPEESLEAAPAAIAPAAAAGPEPESGPAPPPEGEFDEPVVPRSARAAALAEEARLLSYSLPGAEAEPPRPSRAWAFGALLLALVLAVQLAYAFRSQIALRYPPMRPILESACANAGCTVPWLNDESLLKLEDSELLEVPGKPGQIALSARIRNLAATPQEFPHLELTLTDTSGQTAVRRVLRPMDYIGRAPETGEVFAAGAEMLVSIRLETGRVKATGYELLLFYP